MRLWKLSITLLLCALPVLAQDDSEAAASMPGGAGFVDLPAFLELSEGQAGQLHQLKTELFEQVKPLVEDLAEAEKALQEILASPAPDPETVGNLVIAIHSGRLQIGDIQGVHRILAIGILDSDQQAKLNPLRLASFLRLAAQQAVSINLIGAHEPLQGTGGGEGGL